MATYAKRGDTYKITVSCGYDLNGDQIRKHTTWTPAPGMTPKQEAKELERQMFLFEEKCSHGQVLDGSIKFADFAEMWFTDYANSQLRPKTITRYRSMMERINAGIGHIRLDHIQPHHLITFYNNLSEKGIRDDGKYKCKIDFNAKLKELQLTKVVLAERAKVSEAVLRSIAKKELVAKALNIPLADLFTAVDKDATLSNKTILHHHRLLSSIFATAVEWQIIINNPCERAKAPKPDKVEPKYLDEVDAAKLLELLEDEDMQYRTMITLLLMTGLRRGELLGLEWDDIDFARDVINVERSSLYLPDRGIYEDDTKTDGSRRFIKVPKSAMQLLSDFQKWQIEQRLKVGDQWQKTNRLFTSWNGAPLHPDTLSGWFRDFVKMSGLPNINVHSLRHTNATLQIAGGVPITTVASRLGHATPATTTKIYAHAIRSADEAAAETLQNILKPSENRSKRTG